MRHPKEEMVEIEYKSRRAELALDLAQDLLSFGVDVSLTTEADSPSYGDYEPYFSVYYILSATTTKNIWMNVCMHRNKNKNK